uniref:Transient-receptor-potential-like protein n=1 Tax=Diabrotica virgifera virgifera TaxID=50390 RepID=A0A6P7GSP6_DIAVI
MDNQSATVSAANSTKNSEDSFSNYDDVLVTAIRILSLQNAEISALVPKYHGYPHEDLLTWLTRIETLQERFGLTQEYLVPIAANKLRGVALTWFHTNLPRDTPFEEFKDRIIDQFLGNHFVSKKWHSDDNFIEYFEDKALMGKILHLPEKDIIKEILDGITDKKLKKVLKKHNFRSLEAFQKKVIVEYGHVESNKNGECSIGVINGSTDSDISKKMENTDSKHSLELFGSDKSWGRHKKQFLEIIKIVKLLELELNILFYFSALKLVHLFSINPHLGPLQISLGRMVIDIVKFFFIYSLVLFAFACGLNQLLWYFSDLEKKKCYHLPNGEPDFDGAADACMKWRRFANVFESSQSLFWASFGMVDLSSFELTGIKTYTRFWGLLMFGSYSVINVIVLLNLLIAMMSNSYAMIDEHSDTEWKFARTKLWMSYFEETGTLPPPFNIFPKPKMLFKLLGLRKKDKMRRMSTKRRNREEKERDYRYTAVMRALVWRYVSAMHRKCDEAMVTEDDVNELKSDISSFRYEILEVLGKNGMDISSAERKEKAILGKKMKVWERRLMKDFKVAPISQEEDEDLELFAPPPENENSLAR